MNATMQNETKIFLGIIVFTVILIGGAIFFLSRPSATTNQKIDPALLVRPESNRIGSESAQITLVEFGDYQCPACGTYHAIVKTLTQEFANELIFVMRNFPLESIHQNGRIGSAAVEAAGKQGKLWEMHNYLYEHQKEWSGAGNVKEVLGGYAKNLNLDVTQFIKDLDAQDVQKKIVADVADGNSLGVNSTPTFYLNNEKLENPGSLDDFRTLIKAAILKAPKPTVSAVQPYHTHFNLKIVINGKAMDLTLPKYQSSEENELNVDIHVHDGNGDVVHIHKKGVILGDFLTSLGVQYTDSCFIDDLKNQNCNSGSKSIKLYINDQLNTQGAGYIPQDLDRILLSYGSEDEVTVQKQKDSVTDTACIYSEKCPERGTPPTENCVGGLGTGCKE